MPEGVHLTGLQCQQSALILLARPGHHNLCSQVRAVLAPVFPRRRTRSDDTRGASVDSESRMIRTAPWLKDRLTHPAEIPGRHDVVGLANMDGGGPLWTIGSTTFDLWLGDR